MEDIYMEKEIKIEICCGSVDDCITAKKSGAHRVELVSAHQLGGLTPTAGTLYQVKNKVDITVAAIIRPRMSGFNYSQEDYEVMCYDTRHFVEMGADGIVFGFLKEDSTLDYERCARLLEIIGDRESVFHRAIDIIKEPHKAIEQLIGLGVTRILTSGFVPSSYDGRETIKELQKLYGDKIQILAGGGITETNVSEILSYTGINQVHFGGTGLQTDSSCLYRPSIPFGSLTMPPNECYIAVDETRIQKIIGNI